MKNTFDLRTFLAENKNIKEQKPTEDWNDDPNLHMYIDDEEWEKEMGRGDEVKEQQYFGPDGDSIIEIIKDRAINNDSSEIDEAMEVMEFIGEHFGIDFDFGRHSMEEETIDEMSPDAVDAITALIGAGGIGAASVGISKLLDALESGKLGDKGKAVAAFLKQAGAASKDATQIHEEENKDDLFKEEIKKILKEE